MSVRRVLGVGLVLALQAGAALPAEGQIGRIRRAVEREVERTAEEMAVNATRCALGNTRCVEDARRAGKPVVITDANGQVITDRDGRPISDPGEAARQVQGPGEGVWRNYDFVPGTTVWKATDFTGEPLGRFPARQLEYVSGNLQIVEREGARVLEATSAAVFRVPLPEELPETFSVEFHLRIPAGHIVTRVFTSPLESSVNRHPHDYLQLFHTPGIHRAGREVSGTQVRDIIATMVPVKLQVQDDWAILYVGSERVAQVPTANFARGRAVEFHLAANANAPTYVTDIVVAVGLDDLYQALMGEGSFTTRGIFFDSDSDRLRPESTPVLREITSTLTQHTALRVEIQGHTDSQGDDAHNLDLSLRRARAVVNYLAANGIAAERLPASAKESRSPWPTMRRQKAGRRIAGW